MTESSVDFLVRPVTPALGTGLLSGFLAGVVLGTAEAVNLILVASPAEGAGALWWAPLAYGTVFSLPGGLLSLCWAVPLRALGRPSRGRSLAAFGLLGCASMGAALQLALHVRNVGSSHGDLELKRFAMLTLPLAFVLIAATLAALMRKGGSARPARVMTFCTVLLLASNCAIWVVLRGIAAAETPESRPGRSGPNIIFIVLDTLRADCLPFHGAKHEVHVPNLRAFSRDAIQFSQAVSHAAWTKPAMASLLSGMLPPAHGARVVHSVLPDQLTTFPEILRETGYLTMGISNNAHLSSEFGFGQGFDVYRDKDRAIYFGAPACAEHLSFYRLLRKLRVALTRYLRQGNVNVRDYYRPADEVASEGLALLDEARGGGGVPLLLYLQFMDVHEPYLDRAESKTYSHEQLGWRPDADRYADAMRDAYLRELEYLDENLGCLLEGLRSRDMYDSSLIVVTADHGEEFADHGGWWHGYTLYEEMVRVPLLIKLPGNALGGTRREEMVRHIDVAPTLLGLAGAAPAPSMQGRNLLHQDAREGPPPPAYIESLFFSKRLKGVRITKGKIVFDETNEQGATQVFDLIEDTSEQDNLHGKRHGLERELRDTYENLTRESPLSEEFVPPVPAHVVEQLESLGYAE